MTLTEHPSFSGSKPISSEGAPVAPVDLQPETPPLHSSETIPLRRDKKAIIRRLAALLLPVVITVGVLMFAPQLKQFAGLGYFGIFLINLIASATIVVPIPGLGVTFVSAGVLSWPLVGLASGLGQALGESSGYLAGVGGGVVVEDQRWYPRVQYWMKHHGFLTLFILSAIPNPLVDLAGMTAGVMKYPYPKFFLAVWLGKTVKSLVFAWAGAHSVDWLLNYFT